MINFSDEELQNALKIISSTIIKCEKMQLKFKEGTSQYSLLSNRIKAMEISKSLVERDSNIQIYNKDDFDKALPPVISIINKTEKAQSKYEKGSVQFKRFSPIIEAMYVAKLLIIEEIENRA